MKKFHMQNREKQITDRKEIEDIIKKGKYAVIAMCNNNQPYIVTLNYGYDESDNLLYFHADLKGLKMEYLKQNNNVCLTIIEDLGYMFGMCEHSFRSIVCWGNLILVEDLDEKKHGINIMIRHLESNYEQVEKSLSQNHNLHLKKDSTYKGVAVLKFHLKEITGKANIVKDTTQTES